MDPNLPYRDSEGRELTDYPRPSVAVDTAVLTVVPKGRRNPGCLGVLLVRREAPASGSRPGWALPGTFLHPGERLSDAASRSLTQKARVDGRDPRQLQVFDAPDRDDRGWVLSVAHLDVQAFDELEAARDKGLTRIAPVASRLRLPFDHSAIIQLAVKRLRAEYASTPDPGHLIGPRFSLAELRRTHEAVAGHALQKDTFRRAMIAGLHACNESTAGSVGRPATLFARV